MKDKESTLRQLSVLKGERDNLNLRIKECIDSCWSDFRNRLIMIENSLIENKDKINLILNFKKVCLKDYQKYLDTKFYTCFKDAFVDIENKKEDYIIYLYSCVLVCLVSNEFEKILFSFLPDISPYNGDDKIFIKTHSYHYRLFAADNLRSLFSTLITIDYMIGEFDYKTELEEFLEYILSVGD